MKISDIHNMKQLYKALNTNYSELNMLVNNSSDDLYKETEIPKKNGNTRKIYIPNNKLLKIQKRLKVILNNSFRPHKNAMGFIKNKSILDNASFHVNKKYILNIDLENFFENISSGRVYTIFNKYFKITNKSVCFFLTRLCCHPENFLPQGAPTSPTISNIISKNFDKQMTNLTKMTKITIQYSRYADDITFSSNYLFPKAFLNVTGSSYEVGKSVQSIIDKNGFKINESKIRYQKSNQHQEVTGIVVNEKLNINRKYIRNIRAMLHSIKMDCMNLDKPVEKFNRLNNRSIDINGLFKIIRGKIEYVKMIKGNNDKVYQKLAVNFNDVYDLVNEMNELTGKSEIKSVNKINVYSEYYTFLVPDGEIYYDNLESMAYGQGTAFLLKNYGIISNYHVFEHLIELYEESDAILFANRSRLSTFNSNIIINSDYPKKILNMKNNQKPKIIHTKLIKYSKEKDLILLEPLNLDYRNYGYSLSDKSIKVGEPVKLIGYPNFKEGNDVRIVNCNVVSVNESKNNFEIDSVIFSGNSGGPILNIDNEVIGVASEGRGNHENIVRTLEWLIEE